MKFICGSSYIQSYEGPQVCQVRMRQNQTCGKKSYYAADVNLFLRQSSPNVTEIR